MSKVKKKGAPQSAGFIVDAFVEKSSIEAVKEYLESGDYFWNSGMFLFRTSRYLCPSDSIDYAVMEKTADAVVVPMDAGWSDIRSWSSLWDISEKDGNGNATYGDVMLHESNNSYTRTDES
jgi:mannose-1-phosphate guanylyltransferase